MWGSRLTLVTKGDLQRDVLTMYEARALSLFIIVIFAALGGHFELHCYYYSSLCAHYPNFM